MHPAVGFMVRHGLIGAGIALAFVGVILALDIAKIRTLIGQSEAGHAAFAMLVVGFASTFGAVQIAFAVMLAPRDEK